MKFTSLLNSFVLALFISCTVEAALPQRQIIYGSAQNCYPLGFCEKNICEFPVDNEAVGDLRRQADEIKEKMGAARYSESGCRFFYIKGRPEDRPNLFCLESSLSCDVEFHNK